RKLLPFTLTQQQQDALAVLIDDALRPLRMHRLLQGDVGSGKTVVAFFACLPALHEGLQVAWLVPTETLARQAFSTLLSWCEPLGITVEVLSGSCLPGEKKRVLGAVASGSTRVLVGTHALLQPSVSFKKLGMIVIDEQHKFGAAQRLVLQEKDPAADFLLMSATPIPQTIAQTMYGDLDVVSIDGLPPGRMPVKTYFVPEAKRSDMETYVYGEIVGKAAQVYCIVPRIVKDDEFETIKDAQTVHETLSRGAFSGLLCEVIHGRTPPFEQQRIIKDFKNGVISVLVSTTIVEVGIDAPNATIIIIENAERFGLAQLHQLRGRVGRSTKPSQCYLLANTGDNPAASERIAYFCSHHNGFEIAEMDLRLRGPGEVLGLRQTGADDLIVADIMRDAGIFREILGELETALKPNGFR
ncbi:MAG TPA: helicase-related protein, partial [Chitinivibrionales bacterium]